MTVFNKNRSKEFCIVIDQFDDRAAWIPLLFISENISDFNDGFSSRVSYVSLTALAVGAKTKRFAVRQNHIYLIYQLMIAL